MTIYSGHPIDNKDNEKVQPSAYTVVVIRHLPRHRPTVSKILHYQGYEGTFEQMKSTFLAQAYQHIARHMETFIEFQHAGWFVEIVNTETDELLFSDVIDVNDLFKDKRLQKKS